MRLQNVFSKLLVPAVILIASSCTIIQDSDITSAAELAKLKLKSFGIKQQTSKGNSTIISTLLYDSTVNITDPSTGARITRKLRYRLPAMGDLKMKLRSGTTAGTEFTVSYMSDNQPFNFTIFDGDSVVEQYHFRYNSSSKLVRIVTILNPVDGKPEMVRTNDTLEYNSVSSTTLNTLVRRSPDASRAATIGIEYSQGGNTPSITNFSYQPYDYQQQNGGDCSNSSFDVCGSYSVSPHNAVKNNNVSYFTVLATQTTGGLAQLSFLDGKISTSSRREYDTYYFHPLMLLRNQLSLGSYLLILYSIDWELPGPVIPDDEQTDFTADDIVTFTFTYGF